MNQDDRNSAGGKGPFRVLMGVLLKPRATLTTLSTARRRWWWLPALLMIAALTLHGVVYSSANARDMARIMEASLDGLPPQTRGVATPQAASGLSVVTVVRAAGQVLGTFVAWLTWAGLLYLASTFLGQNGAHFGGFFAMVAWTWMPYTVRGFVQAAYTAVTQNAIYNQGLSGLVVDRTPTAAGLVRGAFPLGGALTGPTRGDQVLAALLARVDVYLIWYLVLVVLGVAAFARLNAKKAVVATLVIWVLFTLVGLLPTLVGFGQGFGLF